jgi:hypothetical protein
VKNATASAGVRRLRGTLDGTIGGWELSGIVPEPATCGCIVIAMFRSFAARRRR